MFGNKLRAWMEAVRPKKKQHRKEKQAKNVENSEERPNNNHHSVTWKNSTKNSEKLEPSSNNKESLSSSSYSKNKKEKLNEPPPTSRYSANNLSSPESAYSTGYSTDGTSPGGIPPPSSVDYLANSRQLNKNEKGILKTLPSAPIKQINPNLPCTSRTAIQYLEQAPNNNLPSVEETDVSPISFFNSKLSSNNNEPAVGLISPRQRNRIRTNPWLPGGSNSNISSPIPNRPSSEINKATPMVYRKIRNSPIQYCYFQSSTAIVNMQRRSLSSSSCSSVSNGLNTNSRFPRCSSLSDEDDCTLNEMMGKYDESYIYEKETDILSDSDPTDCESDIDTGQDGGDEEDNGDEEFDFIDNGSYIDLANKVDYNNTGHCMYILSSEMHQRKRSSSSKRRTQRRSTNKNSENKRRRSGSNRKSQKLLKHSSLHQDGSKSAGATPVSMRKSDNNNRTAQKLLHEELCLKKRSNSVSFQRDIGILIDKRDREDDIKYRELIGQAEQIIRTMNINGLSPRRVPGPANKRVELLKFAECASNNKPEVLFNNKTFNNNNNNNNNEEIIPPSSLSVPNSNNIIIAPSTSSITFKNSTRFSPKKNHITNFIINNSPVLIKKELTSPLVVRKLIPHHNHELPNKETIITFKKVSPKIKSILHKTTPPSSTSSQLLISPRHRRESECPYGSSSSSEDENFQKSKKILSKSCPLSEPMRRKVYYGRNTLNFNKTHNQGKTVAFNLNKEILSSENLRHQVLLNTMQTLKKNLEDHSATLQQTYHHKNY